LSQSRADSVLNALRSAKVKMKTLTSIGYGESTPIAENTTEEGREANRRIEFSLIKPVASTIGLSTKAEEASNE
jgi:OOP family OmpA-OmpF porin